MANFMDAFMHRLRAGLDRIQSDIDRLYEITRGQPVYRWATVVSVSPLQIHYDLEDAPVSGSPDNLVAGLTVGDRVWCMRIYRRDIVLGKGQ